MGNIANLDFVFCIRGLSKHCSLVISLVGMLVRLTQSKHDEASNARGVVISLHGKCLAFATCYAAAGHKLSCLHRLDAIS